MNLDEKIRESTKVAVQDEMTKLTELFQEAGDDVSRFRDLAYMLGRILPLLEDVKMEVYNIQQNVHKLQPKEEDDDDPEEEDRNRPIRTPDPKETNRILEAIEGIRKQIEDFHGTKELSIPEKGVNPRHSDGWLKLKKLEDLLPMWVQILMKLQDLKDWADDENKILENRLNDSINESDSKFQKWWKELQIDLEAIPEILDGIKDIITDDYDEMKDSLSQCCSSMHDDISEIDDTLTDEIKPELGHIKTMVSQLQPTTMANQSLVTIAKSQAILAELAAIRGYL